MKINTSILKNLLFKNNEIFRGVYADDNSSANSTTQNESDNVQSYNQSTNQSVNQNSSTSNTTINFETLIAKARQEEKEKLYPQIQKLKTELEEKTKKINELLLALGEKDEVIRQLKSQSNKSDSEQVKELKKKINELEKQLKEKETELNNMKIEGYKQKKIAEAGGELIPELVTGSTEEEIDASIELAKQKYKEIVERVIKNTQSNLTSTQVPPANPNVNNFSNPQISVNELENIDLFSPEGMKKYAELRKQLGLK